jgi:hypothetical protein
MLTAAEGGMEAGYRVAEEAADTGRLLSVKLQLAAPEALKVSVIEPLFCVV